jgi:predicted nucleic acid-binding protein
MNAFVLIDAGPLIAYYSLSDVFHKLTKAYFEKVTEQFITTAACVTEAMFGLQTNVNVQNELLLDLARGLFICENLIAQDYSRIAELNIKYKDLPADFADLSLIAIAERLGIDAIASFDSDFNIYKRLGKQHFKRVFPIKI